MGDIIITRQLPADALLWTRDPDFSPLAALGVLIIDYFSGMDRGSRYAQL